MLGVQNLSFGFEYFSSPGGSAGLVARKRSSPGIEAGSHDLLQTRRVLLYSRDQRLRDQLLRGQIGSIQPGSEVQVAAQIWTLFELNSGWEGKLCGMTSQDLNSEEAVREWLSSTQRPALRDTQLVLTSTSQPGPPNYLVQRTGGGYSFVATQPLVERLSRSPSKSPRRQKLTARQVLSAPCATLRGRQVCLRRCGKSQECRT